MSEIYRDQVINRDCCPFCRRPIGNDTMYLVNGARPISHGADASEAELANELAEMPELWACHKCLRSAEPGSVFAILRDGAYAKNFSVE
jgi:hypothetical protein